LKIVIVATGTEIGKTHVTCALLAFLREAGIPAFGWKPIASGGLDDPRAHARASESDFIEPLYSFERPISPHIGAREKGVTIDFERIHSRAGELERRAGVLVVETAGGMFSPLVPELCNAVIPAPLVLVAPDRLGVLHDVAACVRGSELPIAGVALSAPERSDASTGTNAAEIETLAIARMLAVFPREPWDSPASLDAADRVWRKVSSS
jgi:dethiobiotin synthetase